MNGTPVFKIYHLNVENYKIELSICINSDKTWLDQGFTL